MKGKLQLNHSMYFTFLLACCIVTAAQPPIIQPAGIEIKVTDNACNGVCTLNNTLHSQVQNKIDEILNRSIIPQLHGLDEHSPVNSCADIYQGHPSGYYWLNVANEPQLVYCSLNENHCCGESDGKWMRIAYLNMSDPSAQCPDGWRERQSPIRTCRRQFNTGNTSINSVNYTSYGIPYSRVCGRIIAYQFGTSEGFGGYTPQRTIDDAYVDGISITFGHPRNHIWTFAAAYSDNHCPCTGSGRNATPFVNQDYFCEVGIRNNAINFLDGNPLWDGQGCASSSACCEFNNPPWFCKQLDQTTAEDIEIRIMSSVDQFNSLEEEDTPVELIEIFVQ